MKRHTFNVFSLVLGVILILFAAWIAFPARGWPFGVPPWFLPAAVILVGAALMSPLFTSRDGNDTSSTDNPGAEPPGGESETSPEE